MIRHEYRNIGEVLCEETLPNGLRVYVFEKPDFGKSYAFFATRYGGMDTRFCLNGQWLDTPMGIAHYLEHKMFDMPEGNALQALSKTGASPNAFTSSALTGYHFECAEHFEENLRTLLRFVSTPYFTEESVEKERGIIGQEIRMIEDNPDWQVFHMLLESLYHVHPLRNSVAGSIESIAEITAETLYHCHEAFYTPSNMVLCVAGQMPAEEICRIAEEILPAHRAPAIPRDYGTDEPCTVYRPYAERRMAVSAPNFMLGIKLPADEGGQSGFRRKLLADLSCELLMGSSSPLYSRLYAEGLIDGGFFCGCENYPGCAFMVAGGESRDPQAVRQAVLDEVARVCREGVDEARFNRLKKASYGSLVRALNSFQHLCVEQARGYFNGIDNWRFPEEYAGLTAKEALEFIRTHFNLRTMSLVVVRPAEEAK